LGAALALIGCGQSGGNADEANADDEVLSATESIKEFGDYIVYFNALSTDQLDAEIAAEYDIVRSKNRVLLNIVMEHRPDLGVPTVVAGTVRAQATNLTGQLRNLLTREIREGGNRLLRVEAGFRTVFGAGRRREIVLWQKVVEPRGLVPLVTREVPPEYRKPGTWRHDALALRDRWESRLLRTTSWSPWP